MVTSIRRNVVRLAIDAPKCVKILRAELQRPHHPSPDPLASAANRQAQYHPSAGLAETSEQPADNCQAFRVLLIDQGRLEIVYECGSRNEANAWVEEWDNDHLGMPAIVWPAWAPLHLAAMLRTADAITEATTA